MIDAVQRLGQELPDAPALLGLVRELAQHDGSLAIEIADGRSRARQACHGRERRRHIGRHDDRVDRSLLTRRRRPDLAPEPLDLPPRRRTLARPEDQVLVHVRGTADTAVARPDADREPRGDDGARDVRVRPPAGPPRCG